MIPSPTPRVIILSGIDGSGKSTHATKLAYELRSRGEPAKYLWMRGRGRVFLSLPLLAFCRLVGITKVHKLESGTRVSEYQFHSQRPLLLIWPWLQLLDSLIATLLHITVPLCFAKSLVVDRGVIDSLVDILVDVKTPAGLELLQRLFLSLLPKKSTVIILDVAEQNAMIRKQDLISVDDLKARRALYKALQKRYSWHLLPTDNDFKSVHRNLTELLEQVEFS